ncbi:unnamed protein product [Arctia plantaginis]|uniref:RNA-directed DNA polymerase n=1 Tax=Arctia plantaginis TaxID=874455 RepID=A0A8S0ZL60_ARCPL|nr:unnamed protein product [Arctia plantaginis]
MEMTQLNNFFYKKLVEYDDEHSGSNKKPWTQDRILEVIRDLKNIKVTMKKKSVDYYWMNKYEVITTSSEEYLIAKKKHYSEPTVRIVPREQYFDLLSEIHLSCGHGGRDKMLQDIKSKFYIPKKAVEIFVQLCPVCNSKRSHYRNEQVRLVTSRNLWAGGQFEMIDFQSCADGEYKWLLIYQNIGTKFITVRPLKSSSVTEIASELLTIFLTLGAPNTLKSDLGNDFNENILRKLSTMWPGCKIALDSPINFHQNSEQVETQLQTWMNENNTTNWSSGCYFIQYQRNITFDRTLGKVPYEAVFGFTPKGGLNPSTSTENDTNNVADEQMSNPKEQATLRDDELQVSNIKLEVEEAHSITPDPLNIQYDFEDKFSPPVCENESTDAYKCKSCNSTVHVICAVLNDDLGHRIKISCYVCKNEQIIELERNHGLKRPYEEIDSENLNKLAPLNIGQTVLLSIPKSSRGKFNTKTITGKVVDFRFGVYRVATKIGTIKNWFPRYDLQYVEANYGEVLDKPVTLDEVVANTPVSTVQAPQRCNCRPAVNQCITSRCICFKNKSLCGPTCHKSLTCVNT